MKDWVKKTIYWVPRIIILVFAILIFVFALLSGSERYGGGIIGILKNSPNALPWLILLLIVYFAWKWEKIGGWMLIILSVLFTFFFDAFESLGAFLFLILPILIVGILFLISSKINKKPKKNIMAIKPKNSRQKKRVSKK